MCSVDVMVNKTNYKFGKQTVPVLFICVRDQPEYPTHIHSHTKIKLGFIMQDIMQFIMQSSPMIRIETITIYYGRNNLIKH